MACSLWITLNKQRSNETPRTNTTFLRVLNTVHHYLNKTEKLYLQYISISYD